MSRDFIVKGIRAGQLEYREAAIWGNPYLRVLKSQLERYIAAELGGERVATGKIQTELRRIKNEMADLKKRLTALPRVNANVIPTAGGHQCPRPIRRAPALLVVGRGGAGNTSPRKEAS